MKYIFCAGAPGSKWSSVVKNIYYSTSIDHSDDTTDRTYAHKDQYSGAPMHSGSYFDPGMEFDLPPDLSTLSKTELERRFNEPFTGTGVRIIKSHIFCHNIDFIRHTWPDCPVVLVHRGDDACLCWWLRCGGFDITYPDYRPYYKDLSTIANEISQQNKGILQAWDQLGLTIANNQELACALNIALPAPEFWHEYAEQDIQVKVLTADK